MIFKPISKYTSLTFLIILYNGGFVNSQSGNCFLEGVPGNVFEIHDILETTPANQTLWVTATENIIQASAEGGPHIPYINGLRYSTRYEYQATDMFANFITKERTLVAERNVTFSCEDGGFKNVIFHFNIIDENTCAPEFESEGPFNFTVRKSEAENPSDVINAGTKILVRDLDLDESNANVTIKTTQPVFTATISRDNNVDPIINGYEFLVELSIIWDTARIGEYSFDLIVEDGKFIRELSLIVDVFA